MLVMFDVTDPVERKHAMTKGEGKTGLYRWQYEDKMLTFTLVKDAGKGRELALTSGPWSLQEEK